MDNNKKIKIAVVGLGFGESFAKIYAYHPNVEQVILVDNNRERVKKTLRKVNRDNIVAYDDFAQVLEDPAIDAVHVCTGIPSHAKLSLDVLNSEKHCACAVPMATTLDDIRAIVETTRKTGKNYMMMETVLYGAPYFKAKDMLEKKEFGKVQFMRGLHYQPMEYGYWNGEITSYWQGLPPMHYSTHAIAPLRAIADSRIDKVVCFGSGTMSERLTSCYNNPYPIEDALLSFHSGVKGEVVRGLFECSAMPAEAFNIYGSEKTFMCEYTSKVITKVYDETKYDCANFAVEQIEFSNRYDLLPKEIQRFTMADNDTEDISEEMLKGAPRGAHHGAHPHLCHEFVSSIIEQRKCFVDEDMAANITAAGVCAHISAINSGKAVDVPEF